MKKREKNKKFLGNIRRPQRNFRTFALSKDEVAEAAVKEKNCES
jgi:hypothetical protein